jgi:hypothetical protein
MKNDKLIIVEFKNRNTVKINPTFNFSSLIKYQKLKEEKLKDYRLYSCHILVSLIRTKVDEDKYLTNFLELEDIVLIDVLKKIIECNPEIIITYEMKEAPFESFIIAIQNYVEKTTKDISETIGKVISNYSDQIISAIEEITRVFAENLQPVFEKVGAFAVEMFNIVKSFTTIMLEIEYPPADLSILEMRMVVIWYENGGIESVKEKIPDLLISKYDMKTIINLLNTWKNRDWLKKRYGILEDVVNGYFERRFNLVVPTLLAQLEGIIADGSSYKGKMNGKQLVTKLEELLPSDPSKMSGEIEGVAKRFYREVMLVRFEHGEKIPVFSRHAILHGADTEYGTQLNALKAILLFDFIQDAIQEKR